MLPLLALLACSSPAPRVATPPVAAQVTAFAFARHAAEGSFELPPTTRTAPVSDTFHPPVSFERNRAGAWATPLPVHPDLFPTRQAGARTYGFYAPPGVSITVRGHALEFKRNAEGPWTWGYDHTQLLIGLPEGEPEPTDADVQITWPAAAARERSLQFAEAGLAPAAFVARTLALDLGGRTGLLLPAPARAAWTLTVPAKGRLDFTTAILPGAVAEAASDGATLQVVVTSKGVAHTVLDQKITADTAPAPLKVDLSTWAGEEVEVAFVTAPGATNTGDLVFLGDPVVATPTTHPKRVVLAFVDTVRKDHMGFHGYERATTPRLDAWAKTATIFDHHHTIAPWTLPSARAALSGAQPERWSQSTTLPARLGAAGFVTDGIVANAFLAPTFDMHQGFGTYQFNHLLPAKSLVDHAIGVLNDHSDRDVMVMVQFMEAHLPYAEPKAYQGLFAGDKPDALHDVSKVELDKIGPKNPAADEIHTYVTARYDQNLRVLDDEVSRLIEAAGPDALVVLFSDHGEELWEHGGFEHGHAFWEELLSVPMVISDPHLPAGRFAQPSSLLDLTPTVLDLLGLAADATAGQSLVPAAFGDEAARAALAARPTAFGRPLYGEDGWGVYEGTTKSWTREGDEHAVDLAADPQERSLHAADPRWHGQLAAATGSPVGEVWAVDIGGKQATEPVVIEVRHPNGLRLVWKAYDPRSVTEGLQPTLQDGVARLTVASGQALPSTLYVVGTDPSDPTGLAVSVQRGAVVSSGAATAPTASPLLGPVDERLKVTVERVWVPEPFGEAVPGTSKEMTGQLKELGYVQ